MIPADQFNTDGDPALWVVSSPVDAAVALDRPCDTCGGEGGTFRSDGSIIGICAACDGTGRHTFDVEVGDHKRPPSLSLELSGESDACCARTLRVHVIDVAEITVDPEFVNAVTSLNLPPAAEPGMWVVRLKVHS